MLNFISPAEAVNLLKDRQTIMVGGFLNCGSPEMVIDALLQTDLGGFTLIANDTGFPEKNRGKLVSARKIRKAVVSHIGTNPNSLQQMHEGFFGG